MDEGVLFGSVYGVSMGACNGADYVARQPERYRMVNIGFVGDRRYLSWTRLLRGPEPHGRLAGVSGDLKKRAEPHFPLISPRDGAIAVHLR